MTNEEKIFAAFHEAGHALLYYLLGYNIQSIIVDNAGSGRVNVNACTPTMQFTDETRLANSMTKFAYKCLSGYSAEYKYRKMRITGVPLFNSKNSNENDYNRLWIEMHNANKLINKNRYDLFWLYLMFQDTRKIIRGKHEWRAITELSNYIIQKNDLVIDGDVVDNIFDKHVESGTLLRKLSNNRNKINKQNSK